MLGTDAFILVFDNKTIIRGTLTNAAYTN